MGVSRSRVPTIEKAEVTGVTTVRTLRAAPKAMNCTFVYAFVPVSRSKTFDRIAPKRRRTAS